MATTLERVRTAAHARILYLPHAVKQMARPERLISANVPKQEPSAVRARPVGGRPGDALRIPQADPVVHDSLQRLLWRWTSRPSGGTGYPRTPRSPNRTFAVHSP